MSSRHPVPADKAPQQDGEALADRIANVASDRKAIDIAVVDLRGIASYTDFFVVCSGNTERQTKAIHDAVHRDWARPAGSSWTIWTASATCSRRTRASSTASRTSGATRRSGTWNS
jgi:hypothetical protein